MSGAQDINAKVEAVQRLLHDKLGLRKRALSQMVGRAGRRLPKRLQRHAQALAEAQALARNPKLARRLDHAAVGRAYDELTAHLSKIDVGQRRKDFLLRLAGTIAFNILVIIVCFILWLWWRGYV